MVAAPTPCGVPYDRSQPGTRFARHLLPVMGALLLAAPVCSARDLVQLRTSYLGDGVFEYRLLILDDPFIASLKVEALSFRGAWSGPHELPADWTTNVQTGTLIDLRPVTLTNLALPYERVFRLRSAQSSFKQRVSSVVVPLAGQFSTNAPSFSGSGSLVGQGALTALAPCPPEQADGSDTNMTSRFELFRNPMIQELGLIGGEPRFFTLTHQGTARLRLESTTNLVDWSAQAVFQATNGVNRWTNAAGLGGSGTFFRLLHLGPDAPGP